MHDFKKISKALGIVISIACMGTTAVYQSNHSDKSNIPRVEPSILEDTASLDKDYVDSVITDDDYTEKEKLNTYETYEEESIKTEESLDLGDSTIEETDKSLDVNIPTVKKASTSKKPDLSLINTSSTKQNYVESPIIYIDNNSNASSGNSNNQQNQNNQSTDVKYTVSIKDITHNEVYEKNNNVYIQFKLDTNINQKPQYLTINNTEYEVKSGIDNTYYVVINSGNKAGNLKLNYTKIKINNSYYNISASSSIEIEKSPIVITRLDMDNDNISWDFTDKDNSFNNIKIKVTDKNNNVVIEKKLTSKTTKNLSIADYKLKSGEKYKVELLAECNLTQNGLKIVTVNKNIEKVYGNNSSEKPTEPEESKINFSINYIESLIEKNSQSDIKFNLTESVDGYISHIYINNSWEPVIVNDNGEIIYTYTSGNKAGTFEIKVSKVRIGDKEYNVDINSTLEVLKSLYTVENIALDNKVLKFNIVDNDNSFLGLELVVTDKATNTEIYRQNINKDTTEINLSNLKTNTEYTAKFNKKHVLNLDGTHTKNSYITQSISIDVNYNDSIGNLSADNKSYNKADTITLKFSNNNILNDKIVAVDINGVETPVSLSESNYVFDYTLPNIGGTHEVSMTKVKFEDGTEFEFTNPRKLTLNIIKDMPIVSDIKVLELTDTKAILEFNLTDADNTMLSKAEVVLISNDNIIDTYEVTVGNNSIDIELEPETEYTVEVKASYNIGDNNIHENKVLKTITFESPYEVRDSFTSSNIVVKNSNGAETNKFSKGDNITLEFTIDDERFNATKVVINSNEYPATTSNQVITVELTADNSLANLNLQSIKDSNNTNILLTGDTQVELIIIKEAPFINGFNYVTKNNNTLNIELTLNDSDSTLDGNAVIKVLENGSIIKSSDLALGKNNINVDLSVAKDYSVVVEASYNLSSDPVDKYVNKVLLEEDLKIALKALDFKDIKSVKLYNASGEVESLDSKPTDLSNYYMEIEPLNAQKIYTDVESFTVDASKNKIYAKADLDGFLSYPNGIQTEGFSYSVEYTGEDTASVDSTTSNKTVIETPATNNPDAIRVSSAQELFDGIRANKYGNFILTKDIDATGLNLDNGYGYSGTFWGVIDGNGYTISNMPCPLVWGMTGGEVYNLTLDSSKVEGKASFIADIANGTSIIENVKIVNSSINAPNIGNVGGIVAKYEANSTISNCILEGCTITGNNAVGGIVGYLNNSNITDCALIDCSITGNNTVGGIVGYLNNSNITDCALIDCSITGNNTVGGLVGNAQGTSVISKTAFMGSVTGTLSGNPNGSRAAGGVGWLSSASSITNCLIDVELTAPERKGNGGIFGGPLNNTAGSVDKCVVKVVGIDKNSISGADDALVNTSNVYQLSSNPNIQSGSTLSTINHYDSNYLVTNLGLKKDYADVAESLANPMGGVISLSVMEGYSDSKEIAYNNIVKLAPWLDSATVISTGNNLTGDLASKNIISIYPMDANDKFIHVIDSNTTGSVSKIRVLYEDKTFENLALTHDSVISDLVDTYTVNNYSIPYQFNKYIYKDTLELTSKLNTLASSYSYANNIATVYGNNVINQYDYIYQNVVSDNLDTFTKNLVASNFASLSTNVKLKSNLESDLTNRLPKLLYGYTYFRKNFGFEMGGVDIADLIYFDAGVLNPSLNLDTLVRALDSYDKGMSNAYNVFETVVKGATGITLYDQLELFLKLGGVSDYDAWLQDYLDCHIISRPPEGYTLTTAEYSLWDNLTNPHRTGGNCHVLAVLTIPKEFQKSIGIVSTVGTILFTDIHIYYGNPTEENHVQFQRDLDTMGLLYARYFGTSLGYIPNGEANVFKDLTIQYDSITSYKKAEYQNSNYAQNPAPMIKWVSEATGKTKSTTAGAVSTGDYIYYGYNQALINLGLFSHENAHSMDGSYFLAGYGRRPGGTYDVEFYTEGFFTEPGSEGIDDISATRAFKHNINDELIAALDYERLNTADEIEDYYKDLFNAAYAYDTMAGKAFIAGGKDIQYKVGKFGYFTNDDNNPDRWNPPVGDKPRLIPFTGYWNDGSNFGTELKTFDDLWTHKISYKGIYGAGNGYERPKFYEINWWTPSNNAGSTDSNTFKRFGYEMLGYAGWEEGMIGWASGKYKSDEEAVRNITGYSGMEEYIKARFTEADNNLYKVPYFDSDAMEEVILALYNSQSGRNATSAMDLKALILNTVKRVTDDFTDGNMHQMTTNNYYEVDTAQELVDVINNNSMKKGVYIKLTDDIDLTGVSGGDGYFAEHFIGIINGDGYTISGLSKPLLKSSKFAMFSGINFEGDASVLVSNSARYTFVYNCNYDTISKLYVDFGSSPCNFAFENNKPKPVMMMKSMKSVSDNSVSGNSVSGNSISGNSVSGNSLTPDSVSDNDLKLDDSKESVSGNNLTIDSVSNNGLKPVEPDVPNEPDKSNVSYAPDTLSDTLVTTDDTKESVSSNRLTPDDSKNSVSGNSLTSEDDKDPAENNKEKEDTQNTDTSTVSDNDINN